MEEFKDLSFCSREGRWCLEVERDLEENQLQAIDIEGVRAEALRHPRRGSRTGGASAHAGPAQHEMHARATWIEWSRDALLPKAPVVRPRSADHEVPWDS